MAEAPLWLPGLVPESSGLMLGCTSVSGGCSEGPYTSTNMALHVGDEPARVQLNRQRLSAATNCSNIAWLDQVHGNRCVAIPHAQTQALPVPQADACWTLEPRQALAVLTADCVPVLLWSSGAPAVAAAHAGWRGLHTGVIAQAVAALASSARDLQARSVETLSAWIGPCISAEHYEVGEDVWGHFADTAAAHVHKHPRSSAKRLLDLPGIAGEQLAQLGVENIYQSGYCSYADQRFYSYRRDGVTGRTASVIARLR